MKPARFKASVTFDVVGPATVTIRGKVEPGGEAFERRHDVWVR